ncbi:MAG TPA: hypothetical protein VF137_10065 [Candidatus Dormibacteraeota bacterium]
MSLARPGRLAALVVAWGGAGALVALWAATRGSLELSGPNLGGGLSFAIRLDAIGFVCSLALLVPGAAWLTFGRAPAGWLLAALAAGLVAVNSADLVLTAFAAGAALLCASAASDWGAPPRVLWLAVLLAAWAGVSLQVVGGTAGYGAAPPAALNAGIAGLVLVAGALLIGAVPRFAWPAEAWRQGLHACSIALPPIGFCLLFRVYTLGAGHLPHPAMNVGLAFLGAISMLEAAWLAQAAPDRRSYLAYSIQGTAAPGLLAAAASVQLGLVALTFTLFATALVALLLPLLSERRREDGLLAAAIVAGFPPTIGFAARLLALQSAFEAQQAVAFAALPAALGWLLWLGAGARAAGLTGSAEGPRAPRTLVTRSVGVAALALGALAGPLALEVAQPAAAAAGLGQAGPRVGISILGLQPASAGWPALGLGGLIVLVAIAAWVPLGARVQPPASAAPQPLPAPRLALRLQLPSRFALGSGAAEAMLTGRRPLFWALLVAALAIVVTRVAL